MTLQELGVKDLETVCLKTRERVVFGNRILEPGEPVLYFDNVQIALLSEQVTPVMARGGWGNEPLVIWEDRRETVFSFTNGTLNAVSFNLLLNANMLQANEAEPLFMVEKDLETDEQGNVQLKWLPNLDKKFFAFYYDLNNIQKKIEVKPTIVDEKLHIISFGNEYAYKTILCDYYFNYNKDVILYSMARERFTNLYSLEATFLMKDENDGLLHTGLLRMPKVRVVSNINLRMGERADPSVSTFNVIAIPESKGNRESVVCEVLYLDEDITAGI